MSKIEQEKVDALLRFAKRQLPDLHIGYRDEPAPTWVWAIVNAFFRVLTRIFPGMGRYSQGFGSTIMFPSRKDYGDLTDRHVYTILRHELVHLLDSKQHPRWFYLSYLFLLPAFWTFRATWELRGYAQNMMVAYEEDGRISDSQILWIASQFTSPVYLWMWPSKRKVLARLTTLRDQILQEELKGFYPDVRRKTR